MSLFVYEAAGPAYLPMKTILGNHVFNARDVDNAVSNPSYGTCEDVGEAKL